MKIVNIIGGLGNQMLQYAFALSLQTKYPNDEVKLDLSHFNGYRIHNGFELEKIFGCRLKTATWKELWGVSYYVPNYHLSRIIRRIFPMKNTEVLEDWRKNYGKYQPHLLRRDIDTYYEGYFHSPKYYVGSEKVIRSAFQFPKISDQMNLRYAKLISDKESICIHIRRGDYVGASAFMGICSHEYYSNALDFLLTQAVEQPQLFVFSNDIEYCKDLLNDYIRECDVHFLCHNTGYNSFRDMQLMTLGKYIIIANSTFSWWGAWLNERDNHVVICPKRWVNYTDTPDIYPDDWIRI